MRTLKSSYRGMYEVVFLPWWMHEEYRLPAGRLTKTELEKVLVDDVYDHEGFRISDDQLEWRRQLIEDECEGDESTFRRYYPTFLRDCFEQTEHKFFAESTKAEFRRKCSDPKAIGDMTGIPGVTRARFEALRNGLIKTWKKPESGKKYVVFADVAEGGPLGDFDCAYVLDVEDVSIVAALHGSRDSDELSLTLSLLGEYYNWALLAVENNTSPDTVRRLWREHRYPNLFWEKDPSARKRKLYRPGWNTNRKTRRIMLDTLRNMARRIAFDCPDENFAEEMDDFVWSQREGRWQAAPGKNDDRIITMGGLLCVAGVDITERKRQAEIATELSIAEKYHLRKKKIKRKEKAFDAVFGEKKGGLIIG